MLGFPPSTEFNKRIPKQKFYENAAVPAAVKRLFADQLRCIYWRNKLAVSTLNLTAGERVTEIEIFELCLTGPKLDEAVLRQIDSEIPYHILFVLSYKNKVQAWISCKDTSANSSAKVSRYLHTDWMPETELSLAISGLSLEAVYDGLVRQIARLQGESWSAAYSIAENIQRSAEREKLQKQIAALENKIRKEKQFNRQVEMNVELKQLKRIWNNLQRRSYKMDNDLSSVHTAAEIPDMRSTIDDISKILKTIPFNEDAARQKIYEINAKHPDNKMIWNLFHANIPSGISIQQASKENLYQDLQWKAYYLEAKILGKSVDEMRKEWQNR